jgi:hypothetical protein
MPPVTSLPPGSYFVATLTLSISGALAPGTYHIFLDPARSIVTASTLNDFPLITNQVTINVVPEPATAGLALLGCGLLLCFVR